jgi:hypothetical protein
MSDSEQQVDPDTPSGHEPTALSNIETQPQESSAITTPDLKSQGSSSTKSKAWWKKSSSSPEVEVSNASTQQANAEQHEEIIRDDEAEVSVEDSPSSESEAERDTEDESLEEDSLLPVQYTVGPNILPPLQAQDNDLDDNSPPHKIIFPYICKVQDIQLSREHRSEGPPPPLPPRPAPPSALSALLSFLTRIYNSIMDLLINEEPAIIEYSNEHIKQKMNEACIETQLVEFDVPASSNPDESTPDKIVGVIARLHIGEDEERSAITINARPMRVRQLMREDGLYLVEDVYEEDLKEALKKLGKLTGV